jgi:hypothetical protein
MNFKLKAALALVFLASVPVSMQAAPSSTSGILSARDVRKAEAEAKTAADHRLIAAYYQSQAQKFQTKLSEQEELVNYWGGKSWMVGRTKQPNAYSTAVSLAQTYRAELARVSERAAYHMKMAESLPAGGAGQ